MERGRHIALIRPPVSFACETSGARNRSGGRDWLAGSEWILFYPGPEWFKSLSNAVNLCEAGMMQLALTNQCRYGPVLVFLKRSSISILECIGSLWILEYTTHISAIWAKKYVSWLHLYFNKILHRLRLWRYFYFIFFKERKMFCFNLDLDYSYGFMRALMLWFRINVTLFQNKLWVHLFPPSDYHHKFEVTAL